MAKRTTSGFTLIELMIVVAIVGVLSALGVPRFIEYIERSKDSESFLNLKNMYGALSVYFNGEHANEGMAGGMGTHCLPDATNAPTPWPIVTDAKVIGNFTDPTFQALDFAPSEPLYHSYYVWNPAVNSACNVRAVTNIGNVSAINDRDGDGDLRVFVLNWDVIDGELMRAPAVNIQNNWPNPWSP